MNYFTLSVKKITYFHSFSCIILVGGAYTILGKQIERVIYMTIYDDQLKVILSRLEGMTYDEARKYYEFASKNYGMTESEKIILLANVEKLK